LRRVSQKNGAARDVAVGVAVASGAVLAVAGVAWVLWPRARPAIATAVIPRLVADAAAIEVNAVAGEALDGVCGGAQFARVGDVESDSLRT
jgi:hypothetical protein